MIEPVYEVRCVVCKTLYCLKPMQPFGILVAVNASCVCKDCINNLKDS